MKGPKAIKILSIAALTVYTALLVLIGVLLMTYMTVALSPILFIITVTFLAAPVIYPIQLLLIRRNYYRNRPATPSIMTWTHIFRVIQLLQTLIFLWRVIGYINDIYVAFKDGIYLNNFYSLQIGLTLVLCISIPLNLLIFFKGWRLLKVAQGSYVEDVMSTFDEPSTRQ